MDGRRKVINVGEEGEFMDTPRGVKNRPMEYKYGNLVFLLTNYELNDSVYHTKTLSICSCVSEGFLYMIPWASKGKVSEALGENGVGKEDRILVDADYLENSVKCSECQNF